MDETTISAVYEIRLRGLLGGATLSAFPKLCSRAERGITVLSGYLPDQAALFGVLDQIERLGLELIEIHRVE